MGDSGVALSSRSCKSHSGYLATFLQRERRSGDKVKVTGEGRMREEKEEEQIESSPGRTQTGRTHTSTEQLISHLSCLQAVHLSAGVSNPKTRRVQP